MADATNKHSLADHRYGADAVHTHAEGDDHDHDHDHDPSKEGSLEDNALWVQDNIALTSVGIDIGSSGTQVIFSRLHMRRLGEDHSSRYFVVKRETLYESPVALTPYQSEERIDERALGEIIDAAYAAAKLHPDSVDTGSVILTGEALRRDNAQAIGELLAEMGGEFVCATAGHHMEAMLAGYGSGAAKISHDQSTRILNIDIGGGTTKLAIIDKGKILGTAAIHIGGRLLVVDEAGRISRLDPAGKRHVSAAGFNWKLGDTASAGNLDVVAESMADRLITALTVRPSPPAVEQLYLTNPLADLDKIDGVMFSGGVAEYIYGREARDFGDLGRRLGHALRARIDQAKLPWKLLPAGECIRATAFGASEYSVQLSGNTVYISNPGELLPRKNLQVLQIPHRLSGPINAAALTRSIQQHFTAFDVVEGETEIALAFQWRGDPAFRRIEPFVQGVLAALPKTIAAKRPIYLLLDGDVGQTIGAILKEDLELASEVLVLDGILLRDFDYIDLGRIRMPSSTVPVTIKSLVFSADPRVPAGQGHDHGHGHGHDHSHGHGQEHAHAAKHDHAHDHEHAHDHDHTHDHEVCDDPSHHHPPKTHEH